MDRRQVLRGGHDFVKRTVPVRATQVGLEARDIPAIRRPVNFAIVGHYRSGGGSDDITGCCIVVTDSGAGALGQAGGFTFGDVGHI